MTPGPPENDQSCVKSEVATSGKRGGGGLLKDMEREGGEKDGRWRPRGNETVT